MLELLLALQLSTTPAIVNTQRVQAPLFDTVSAKTIKPKPGGIGF